MSQADQTLEDFGNYLDDHKIQNIRIQHRNGMWEFNWQQGKLPRTQVSHKDFSGALDLFYAKAYESE